MRTRDRADRPPTGLNEQAIVLRMSRKTRTLDVHIPLYRRRTCTLRCPSPWRAVLDDLLDGLGQLRVGHRADWSRPSARRRGTQCLLQVAIRCIEASSLLPHSLRFTMEHIRYLLGSGLGSGLNLVSKITLGQGNHSTSRCEIPEDGFKLSPKSLTNLGQVPFSMRLDR